MQIQYHDLVTFIKYANIRGEKGITFKFLIRLDPLYLQQTLLQG